MTEKQTKANQTPEMQVTVKYGANIPAMQPIAKFPPPPNNRTSPDESSSESGGQSSNTSSES